MLNQLKMHAEFNSKMSNLKTNSRELEMRHLNQTTAVKVILADKTLYQMCKTFNKQILNSSISPNYTYIN